MSLYTLTCPACEADVSMPARRLLVRVDEGVATSGEALFTCYSCGASVAVELDPPALAVLVVGGVTHLSLTAPSLDHPETVADGPPLTHDDLIDLHHALTAPDWLEELLAADR